MSEESTNIKVIIRVRPLLEHELSTHQCSNLEVGSNYVSIQSSNYNNKVFTFDRVLGQDCQQSDIFGEVEPLLEHSLDGLHATIFCYGQTGSGKTFTMEGFDYAVNENGKLKALLNTPAEQHGIIPRAIDSLYCKINERMRNNTHIKYKIHCSYMQVYNEKVFDLLNPNTVKPEKRQAAGDPGLRIRWRKNDQFYVENLFVFECDTSDQVRELFHMGVKNKNMGSHQMNLASSRSHSLFTLYVNSWDPSTPDCIIQSELTLVDLAGSEKLSLLARNPSQRLLQESIDINTSLLALGKVITALGSEEKSSHVPYRESKLTKLLKHALGGNSMTTMIACISPADAYVEETMCTLFYAGRARNIKNDPRINEDPKSALIRALKNEIAELKAELNNYRQLLMADGGQQLMNGSRPDSQNKVMTTLTANSDGSVGKIPTNIHGASDEFLSEKLVESVRIVRDLICTNGQLRTNFDKMNELKLHAESVVQQLNEENVELRERIEMLESIVVQQNDDNEPDNVDNRPKSADIRETDRTQPGTETRKRNRKVLKQYNQRYKNPQGPSAYGDYRSTHNCYRSHPQQKQLLQPNRQLADELEGQQRQLLVYQQQQYARTLQDSTPYAFQQQQMYWQQQHQQQKQQLDTLSTQQQLLHQQQLAQYTQFQQTQNNLHQKPLQPHLPIANRNVVNTSALSHTLHPQYQPTPALTQAKTAAEIWLANQQRSQFETARNGIQNAALEVPMQPHQLLPKISTVEQSQSSRSTIIGYPNVDHPLSLLVSAVNGTKQSSGDGGACGYLSSEEYQKYFTPEQLLILQKRNALKFSNR